MRTLLGSHSHEREVAGPEVRDERAAPGEAGLTVQLRDVELDGVLGASEAHGDLLVRQPADDPVEDLAVALGQLDLGLGEGIEGHLQGSTVTLYDPRGEIRSVTPNAGTAEDGNTISICHERSDPACPHL